MEQNDLNSKPLAGNDRLPKRGADDQFDAENSGEHVDLDDTQLAEIILDQSSLGRVAKVESLGQGFGGRVLLVTLEGYSHESCLLKLLPAEWETPVDQEADDDRVYGARWDNFKPAYNLLAQNGIMVPELITTGGRSVDGNSYNYAALQYLDGVSIREFAPSDNDRPAVEALTGNQMGRINAITRNYHGWVDLSEELSKNWHDLFRSSISNRIRDLENVLLPELMAKINDRVDQLFERWTDPEDFVFSHVDGFQGVAKQEAGGWQFQGVIDIEDHAFTDQRFVLAGYELGAALNGQKVGPEFWQAYTQEKTIDPSYQQLKPLFELYYLLVWTKVFSESTNTAMQKKVEQLLIEIVDRDEARA